jgi:hypothetical protein
VDRPLPLRPLRPWHSMVCDLTLLHLSLFPSLCVSVVHVLGLACTLWIMSCYSWLWTCTSIWYTTYLKVLRLVLVISDNA